MKNIVVISGHGEYPKGIKSFINEVAGNLKNIYYIDFIPSKGVDQLESDYFNIINNTMNNNIIFICDIMGGTPFNKAVEFKYKNKNKNIIVVAGVNVASILECCIEIESDTVGNLSKKMIENTKETAIIFSEKIIQDNNVSNQCEGI